MDDQPHGSHFRSVPHYYGDIVRVLFVFAAILVFITESVAGDNLLSAFSTIIVLLALVLAAGVTNPRQRGIHWINLLLAVAGLLIFGGSALDRYRAGLGFSLKDILVTVIALIFLVSLYFATRTIRGLVLRYHPVQPD
ncbi:MAG: hypothetical protein KGI41_01175 [Patescibacteria group bacterium]|nr:hypothetical protein [Patescibacteria group bacterium]MDE1965838.1 hypothetical protein [Patescibacteria group bacterium]